MIPFSEKQSRFDSGFVPSGQGHTKLVVLLGWSHWFPGENTCPLGEIPGPGHRDSGAFQPFQYGNQLQGHSPPHAVLWLVLWKYVLDQEGLVPNTKLGKKTQTTTTTKLLLNVSQTQHLPDLSLSGRGTKVRTVNLGFYPQRPDSENTGGAGARKSMVTK